MEGGGESGVNGDPEAKECEIFRNDVVLPRTTSRPRGVSLLEVQAAVKKSLETMMKTV